MPKKNALEKKLSLEAWIPSIRLIDSTVTQPHTSIVNNEQRKRVETIGNGNVEDICPGIKEIIDHVIKLQQKINDQEKSVQISNKTCSELQQTNNELASKNIAYQGQNDELMLEIKVQRNVNKEIRSAMQSLQSKQNEVNEMLENERKKVRELEEALSQTKINQEAILKKQLEKFKQQFNRMIDSLEKERRTYSMEDLSKVSAGQHATSPKKKLRNKNKRDKEENL